MSFSFPHVVQTPEFGVGCGSRARNTHQVSLELVPQQAEKDEPDKELEWISVDNMLEL